jgi:hypothetical protein
MTTEIEKAKQAELATSGMYDDSADALPDANFVTIKIIRETAQYQLGEDKFAKVIRFHPLLMHKANQWWEIGFDQKKEGESSMPNCYSIDGLRPCGGDKMQDDFCAVCKQNQFESGRDGRGKACRNTIRTLLIRDGAVMPEVLVCPPTSVGKKSSLQKWMDGLTNEVAEKLASTGFKVKWDAGKPVIPIWPIHAEFGLEKKKFEAGEASIVTAKTLDILVCDTPENTEQSEYLMGMHKAAKEQYLAQREKAVATDDAGGAPF